MTLTRASLTCFDHISPVWCALPWQMRGRFMVHPDIAEHAHWIVPEVIERRYLIPHGGKGHVLVAGVRDLRWVGHRPAVFLEHGAGQTYGNGHPSYAGGGGRQDVVLFLAPSEAVSRRNLEAYPSARSVVVGTPKMDPWHRSSPVGSAVCISFHWNCVISPEAGSAWNHYREALPELPQAFGEVLGHAHSRLFDEVAPIYEAAGIEPVREFAEVLRRARVYAIDNSSTGWEFMSTDRPVVWLNAPWYRRNVEHGLRFWRWADSGVQVDEPGDLVDGIRLAMKDQHPERRREAVRHVYSFTDGHAAERAACAIEEEINGGHNDPERNAHRSL